LANRLGWHLAEYQPFGWRYFEQHYVTPPYDSALGRFSDAAPRIAVRSEGRGRFFGRTPDYIWVYVSEPYRSVWPSAFILRVAHDRLSAEQLDYTMKVMAVAPLGEAIEQLLEQFPPALPDAERMERVRAIVARVDAIAVDGSDPPHDRIDELSPIVCTVTNAARLGTMAFVYVALLTASVLVVRKLTAAVRRRRRAAWRSEAARLGLIPPEVASADETRPPDMGRAMRRPVLVTTAPS
jgi:hypothetical protein